jgi:hypothetical protein
MIFESIKNDVSGLLNSLRQLDKLFWLLLIIFIGIPISYYSYVPIWDGWEFSWCYINAAQTGILWCYDHSAFVHTFLFSLLQRIDLGSFKSIYAANTLLGILGLIGMRSLLPYLFGDRLSRTNLTLITFCFGLNPVFLAHVIQPSLDFTSPIYQVMLLLFLFKKKPTYAATVGILMVFTKESGFMLYGVSVFLYIPLRIITDPLLLKDKRKFIGMICVLMFPILLFILYMIKVPRTQLGTSWFDGIKKMFRFYLLSKVIMAQLLSLFAINFSWLMTPLVISNIFIQSIKLFGSLRHRYNMRSAFKSPYEQLYFYLLTIMILYFLTRIPFVNNPRYMLPALPLLIVLFAESASNVLRKQWLITIVSTVLLALLCLSSFRTIDPISKRIMGTFKFGKHEMLQMARFDAPRYGYGRDQLVYNFQFTQFHYVTEKIFNTVGWDKAYVTAPGVWIPDLSSFDISTGHRARFGNINYDRPFLNADELIERNSDFKEVYYISCPHFDRDNINVKERAKLSRIYDLEEVITVENEGYSMDVFRYVKKINN